ncbi:MAG: DUF1631 family protein, partial [Lysobacter sp.]
MRFRQQIGLGFDDFMGVRPQGSGAEMGLVGERQMHFHLAGQRLGEVLDQRYQQALEEMNRRLGALSMALNVASSRNPVTPSWLATAFIEAIGDADLPDALGGLLFQQYQQELVRVLDELYPRMNALLAQAGYGAGEVGHRLRPMPVTRGPQRDDEQVAPRFPATTDAATLDRGAGAGQAQGHTQSAWPSRQDEPLLQDAVAPDLAAALQRTSDELAGLRVQLHAWRNDSPHSEVVSERGMPQRRTPQRRDLRVAEVVSIASLLQAESPDVYARALATSGRLSDAIRDHLTEGARRLG